MRPRELHSDYYRDRQSEYDLCNDFPGDEILIDGLHAMQTHMWNNGVNITIPVVRVMNTAHFLAAYMFATTCSGDQLEYDNLANMNLGRDKQLYRIAIIVLAAMLKRTEGFRAKQCRNMLLENRDPDFEEGVTLYDRFLCSAEKRFAEEDFLIDTHAQIQQLQTENTRLISENIKLKYTITTMENQQNNQYNNCVIYNAPVYNTSTTNNYYQQTAPVEEVVLSDEHSQESVDSIIFTKKAKKEAKEAVILQALQKSVQGRNDKARALVEEVRQWQKEGYIDPNYNARVMYDELNKIITLPFQYDGFRKYYNE